MRNFNKAIADGHKLALKRTGLDIGSLELSLLKELFDKRPNYDGLLDVMTAAYYAGLAVGHRNK